mmetsp:Transcript_146193/g.280349  ORF Transcript_146193/g.280349 Transcript_146193/m.280349 type:complete len:131 (+) Transcript_146193:80-472(+)
MAPSPPGPITVGVGVVAAVASTPFVYSFFKKAPVEEPPAPAPTPLLPFEVPDWVTENLMLVQVIGGGLVFLLLTCICLAAMGCCKKKDFALSDEEYLETFDRTSPTLNKIKTMRTGSGGNPWQKDAKMGA